MLIDIKGVHYEVSENVKEKMESKLKRLEHAEDMIVNLDFTITREKQYKLEAKIHFRWGQMHHIKVETFDIWKGVDLLIDKLELKVDKEKERVQDH
ncbi:MAG: ribosome-associated translation inhibitor RaiA [Spirochaetales bacterium]|nr:ribosome-associated translation inhibitor RaiA [Spirochaetales bacterium]